MQSKFRTTRTMKRLNAEQISLTLAGKRIMPDVHSKQKSLRFSEEFAIDGSWTSLREERALVKKRGRWSIINHEICVTVERHSPECREVWKNVQTGAIYISDIGSGSNKNKMIVISVNTIS